MTIQSAETSSVKESSCGRKNFYINEFSLLRVHFSKDDSMHAISSVKKHFSAHRVP